MQMDEYQKKPRIIAALIWDGRVITLEFLKREGMIVESHSSHESGLLVDLRISTLEGPMLASHGDYIIKGVKGEFYPCKPDIFVESYNKLPS